MITIILLLSFLIASSIVLELIVIAGYSRHRFTFVIGGAVMFVNALISIYLRQSTAQYATDLSATEVDPLHNLAASINSLYLRYDFLVVYVLLFLFTFAWAMLKAIRAGTQR